MLNLLFMFLIFVVYFSNSHSKFGNHYLVSFLSLRWECLHRDVLQSWWQCRHRDVKKLVAISS